MKSIFNIAFWNEKLYNENYKFHSLHLMRLAIYVYLLYISLILLPNAANIWGPDSMVYPYPVDVYSTSFLFNLLFHPSIAPYFYWILFLQIVFLVIGIFSIYPRLSAVMIYILTSNLSNRMYMMNTAGEQLLLLLLFFLMFFSVKDEKKTELQHLINNVAAMACFFQLVILYFFSGIYKLYGPEWLNGSALFLTIMMDEFSHPWIKNNLTENNLFLIIGTYITLGYQLIFPIIIWLKKLRKYFLWVGLILHFSIAIVLGIFDFGIIMMIAYLMYLENEKARNILTGFRNFSFKKIV
jgi:hypothetical protein